MSKVNNPFFVSGEIPNQYFCDRVEETKTLTNHILNGRNVVLISPRRVGKTGLINHCYQQPCISEEYYSFYVDILDTSCLRDFTYALGREIFEQLKTKSQKLMELFFQTVRSLNGEFGYDFLTGLPKFNLSLGSIQDPEYTLGEIFEYINKADKRCVIAIDEFQQIIYYPEKNVEAILRTYIQHSTNCNYIFAGSERRVLSEMFNQPSRPFFASTGSMYLDVIDIDKYSEFVQHHFHKFDKSIDQEVVDKVYRLFDGNTYCLQNTMNHAFELLQSGEDCTLDIAELAIRKILEEKTHDYQTKLSMLTPSPKELLFAIAKEGKAQRITSGDFVKRHKLKSSSSVQSATKQLLDITLITFYGDELGNRIYELDDKFLTLWIQDHFGLGFRL